MTQEETLICTTKTTFNREYGEFRVRCFINGVYQAGGDYFTSDREDAKATAKHMQENPCHTEGTSDFAKAELKAFLAGDK